VTFDRDAKYRDSHDGVNFSRRRYHFYTSGKLQKDKAEHV